METYVGEIKVSSKSGYYVNFYPGYRLINNKFVYLSPADIRRLLPESTYLNINLISTSPSFSLEEQFQDGDDILLDFSFDDLQPNLKADGSRYPTAWKLDVSRNFGTTVRRMEDLGFYYLIEADCVAGDWKTDRYLWIESPNVNEGMEVMIPIDQPNILIGPYRVHYDEDQDQFFVRPNPESNKNLIHGFEYLDGVSRHCTILEQEDVTRKYVSTTGCQVESYAYDTITVEELVENLRVLMKKRMVPRYRFDEATAANMIRVYTDSLISGGNVSKEIADRRACRLQKVFSATERFDVTLENVCRLIGDLLLGFREEPIYSAIVEALSEDEEFLKNIGSFKTFALLESKFQNDIDTLRQQKNTLSEQVEELERLNPKKQIEEYSAQIAHLESLRNTSEQRLQETLKTAGLVDAVASLEQNRVFLEAENARKLEQSRLLEAKLDGLQSQLETILASSANKVLEMTFDNLISERFLEQTSKTLQKQMKESYVLASKAVAALPISTLDASQTVLQLTHSFHKKRPRYSNNEILNILICLTQSFLTIFTGRPGSGKTSINEITADVLSLNQPARLQKDHPDFPFCGRFVSIHVERGWTSSRDLVGFYNSLTRTFEKASPQFFDLLSILDAESKIQNSTRILPALVLLDDANLSSMEYYWADFMAMDKGEEKPIRGTLNLAQDYQLQVPDALHFVAAIQTDHTTEPLSPRLLDRAFVISMPDHDAQLDTILSAAAASVLEDQLFTCHQLKAAFEPAPTGLDLPEPLETLFKQAEELFANAGILASIRSSLAMRRYILSGLRWFEREEDGREAGLIALDYAVLQRMLPLVNGTSERFRQLLKQILDFLKTNHLNLSAAKLEEIMEKGDDSMQYYQFF